MPASPAIALLGTGAMGVGMTHALLRAGLPVTVITMLFDADSVVKLTERVAAGSRKY